MVIVNGINGSGFEAILDKCKSKLGARELVTDTYIVRNMAKKAGFKEITDYENYLDKFNATDEKVVAADIDSLLPDGVWPMYNLNPNMFRPVFNAMVPFDLASRVGGSLFNFEPTEITRIYLVLTSPLILWQRKHMVQAKSRRLRLKYIADHAATRALNFSLKEYSVIPPRLEEEFKQIKDYLNNCLLKFPDKLEIISGDGDTLTYTDLEGEQVTIPNRNIASDHGLHAQVMERFNGHFQTPEFDQVRVIWSEIQELLKKKNPVEMIQKTTPPDSWFCARIHENVAAPVCLRCIADRGNYVIAGAKPGWDAEPCAYEVAYGPEPHKTVEESIANHSWGVLP